MLLVGEQIGERGHPERVLEVEALVQLAATAERGSDEVPGQAGGVVLGQVPLDGGGVLSLDLGAALYPLREQRPLLTSFMAGMGGEAVPSHEFHWMAKKLQQVAREQRIEKMTHWVGFEE